ncbi:Iron import ATP-binding/permease protein IrtA [compost metagenome]
MLNSLGKLTNARTTLVVTHDFDTAMRCDRIVWLEAGQIVEEGTREELLAIPSRFAQWQAEVVRVAEVSGAINGH